MHIHRKGLAHGDVKAGNMLVDSKGRIKLADFGNLQKVVRVDIFKDSIYPFPLDLTVVGNASRTTAELPNVAVQ